MPFCEKCDEYYCGHLHSGEHVCPPLWEVCDPEGDPEIWTRIRASNPEEAAAEFCKLEDESNPDYTYLAGGGADCLHVRARGSQKIFQVTVTAEARPTYTGREVGW